MTNKNQDIKQRAADTVQQFAKAYVDLCNKYNLRLRSCDGGSLSIELNYLDDYFDNFLEEVEYLKAEITKGKSNDESTI